MYGTQNDVTSFSELKVDVTRSQLARILGHSCVHSNLMIVISPLICFRFKREANKPSQGNNNMKRILSYCRDIQMKYKLATSLGLTDVVMEMYKGDGSAYLNDTVSA